MLVDFWTYTCINWLRTLAYVRAWAEKYEDRGWSWSASTRPSSRSSRTSTTSGAPRRRCASSIRSRSTATMRSGGFQQPLLAGRLHRRRGGPDPPPPLRRGRIRRVREGHPAAAARGRARRHRPTTSSSLRPRASRPRPTGPTCESPETYLGYEQGQNFASPGAPARRAPHLCGAGHAEAQPVGARRRLDDRDGARRARTTPDGRIAFRFHARDVNLVMGPRARGASVPFRVLVDGEPPGDAHGLDVDEQGRRHGGRTAALPADPPARIDRRPHVRDRFPRAPASRPSCSPSASSIGVAPRHPATRAQSELYKREGSAPPLRGFGRASLSVRRAGLRCCRSSRFRRRG